MKPLGIIIAVVVVGGGAWYFTSSKDAVAPSDSEINSEEIVTTEESTKGMPAKDKTFKDVVSSGANVKCTFTSKDPNAESSGTVYISGEKVRGDFESKIKAMGDSLIKSHMMSDGEFTYTWSEGSPIAAKLPIVNTPGTDNAVASSFSFVDGQAGVGYKCESWKVDASVFSLPTGIQFMTPTKIQ